MPNQLPQIAKSAAAMRAGIEIAWTRCARRHKWGVGKDLRDHATKVCVAVHRAWRDRNNQLQRVRELILAIDELKVIVQLAKDVNAYASFAEFEAIVRLVDQVGRQSGGWLKSLQPASQNAQAVTPGQRAPILSSRAASPVGATP